MSQQQGGARPNQFYVVPTNGHICDNYQCIDNKNKPNNNQNTCVKITLSMLFELLSKSVYIYEVLLHTTRILFPWKSRVFEDSRYKKVQTWPANIGVSHGLNSNGVVIVVLWKFTGTAFPAMSKLSTFLFAKFDILRPVKKWDEATEAINIGSTEYIQKVPCSFQLLLDIADFEVKSEYWSFHQKARF